MAASKAANKDSAAAAYLKSRGIFHGVRQSKPYPDSGGLTMGKGPGSTRYQRRLTTQRNKQQNR